MSIEESIQRILQQKGSVHIDGLGTFASARKSAEMKEQGGVIAPPASEISFSEDGFSNISAKDILTEAELVENADAELADLVEGIKEKVADGGKYGFGGLGYFQKGSNSQLEFIPHDNAPAGTENFGLPKIKARPLVPMALTDNNQQPGSSGLLLKAILIPLVILAFALVFFLVNDDAYKSVTTLFSSSPNPDKEVIDEIDRTNKLIEGSKKGNKPEGNEGTDVKPKTTTDNPKETEKPAEKPVEKTIENKKSSSKTVTDQTNRYYIIIGSFSNDNAAKKAVAKSNKIGYSEAKILKMNGKIRVSVQDFVSKTEAGKQAEQVGKDFPGAWVLYN